MKYSEQIRSVHSFLSELRTLTGGSFVYSHEMWAFDYRHDVDTQHSIRSSFPGFEDVKKDSLGELIESFGLIREKVALLMKSKRSAGKIRCQVIKLIYNNKIVI